MRNMEWRLVWLSVALAYAGVMFAALAVCAWSLIYAKRGFNWSWRQTFSRTSARKIVFDTVVFPAFAATVAALFVIILFWLASVI